MQNILTIGQEYVPIEQIAYIEPFEPPANGQFKSDKPYKGRVVLLNRESILTEDTPQDFAQANGFRLIPEDNVAANPAISFRVRGFKPTENFKPRKEFQTQLVWRDPDGDNRNKLLVTHPETVIAIVIRGETEPGTERKIRPRRPAHPRGARKRAAVPSADA